MPAFNDWKFNDIGKTLDLITKLLRLNLVKVLHLTIIAVLAVSVLTPAFADTVFVEIALESSVPGCEVDNTCFIPYSVTINAGDTVTWTNNDTTIHMVSAGDLANDPNTLGLDYPNGFDSSIININGTFSHTFNIPGTYPYFGVVHPWANGIVYVNGTTQNPNISTNNTNPITVTTDKDSYQFGETIQVSGHTDNQQSLITIMVEDSSKNVVFNTQVTPVNSTYSTSIVTSDRGWGIGGEYTIEAWQADNKNHAQTITTVTITNSINPITEPQTQVQEIKEQWLLDFRAMTDTQKETKYAEAIKKIEKKNNAIANLKEKIDALKAKVEKLQDKIKTKMDNKDKKIKELEVGDIQRHEAMMAEIKRGQLLANYTGDAHFIGQLQFDVVYNSTQPNLYQQVCELESSHHGIGIFGDYNQICLLAHSVDDEKGDPRSLKVFERMRNGEIEPTRVFFTSDPNVHVSGDEYRRVYLPITVTVFNPDGTILPSNQFEDHGPDAILFELDGIGTYAWMIKEYPNFNGTITIIPRPNI